MKSAVTIALVPEIKQGPWVYWNHLETGMRKAADLGFDAVELFTGSGEAFTAEELTQLSTQYDIDVCAVGTGAGKVVQGLTLSDPDPETRVRAVDFIESMIKFGGALGAPAIIGSMQGNWGAGHTRDEVLTWLAEGLHNLSEKAAAEGQPLIYEPLNRYETNLFNRMEDAVAFLEQYQLNNVLLLADLFHMNIEEKSITESIERWGKYIGHVHLADSNRSAAGMGHTDFGAVADAIKKIHYKGYLSAEIFPLPDSDTAAQQTIQEFRKWFSQ